jgi:hypothetical protein
MNNIIDPWNLSKEFLLNFDQENIIKGPCKVIKNINNKNKSLVIERYDINCNVFNRDNSIIISSIERGNSGYKIIEIIIKDIIKNNKPIKVGIIENISRYEKYSGSDLMLLVLQILYRLKVNESTLKDVSYYECIRNNFFKQKEIPTKLIKLLKSNNTFYSAFNYKPYDKNTKKNRMTDLRNLVSKLLQISWLELDEIINAGSNEINIMNQNNQKMKYNILEIRNINKWKKYWITIYNSWNIFKSKFNQARTPFSAFKFFNEHDNCSDFIDWLELYSYTYFNFNKGVFYHFLNKNYEIPLIKVFNQLKEILNNVNWVNYKIIEQSDTFLPSNTIFEK